MGDFARHVNRITPQLPPGAMQTYEVDAPLETHWRAATCEEVGCKAYQQGWTTSVPSGSTDEARLRASGRQWSMISQGDGLEIYHFPAGTTCFRAIFHKLPLERPAIFTVRSGDWRGTDGVIRQFNNGADWVDHFANHQSGIADKIARG
jgi:hypothetical protein